MVTLQTFKLCKQLHELRPGWTPEDRLFIRREGGLPEVVKGVSLAKSFDEAPRFTVDYLLEKLPKRAADGFEYGMLTLGGINGVAETALDAILRLAIEMAERTEI